MKQVTVIILGASGDLATTRLFPALCEVACMNKGVSLRTIGITAPNSDHASCKAAITKHLGNTCRQEHTHLVEAIELYDHDITQEDTYRDIAKLVEQGAEHLIVYCAVPPQLFITVAEQFAKQALPKKAKRFSLVLEKPFGTDAQQAAQLEELLRKEYTNEQVIRADHFLAKDLVNTIAYLRFTNRIVESLWSREHIERITIQLTETQTVAHRAKTFDEIGIINDIVQSHLLQLLALATMQPPEQLTYQDIHAAKLAILQAVQVNTCRLGQYTGYSATSRTATYVQSTCSITTPNWQGVPITLIAGKALPEHTTRITVTFKPAMCRLVRGCPLTNNSITLDVVPEGKISLTINVKEPGDSEIAVPVALDFCYSCMWPYSAQAYTLLLQDIIAGHSHMSVPWSEIKECWRIAQDMQTVGNKQSLLTYAVGSNPAVTE